MKLEVHLRRVRKGKSTYTLAGVVPSIEVESYEEALKHPEVREMIRDAYGSCFHITFYSNEGMKTFEIKKIKLNFKLKKKPFTLSLAERYALPS